MIYRDCYIWLLPPPIPTRAHDYQWQHRDYDGAPDSGDNRTGSGATVQECINQIDELFIIEQCS